MDIKIVASTKENYQGTKEEFDSLAGHGAGVCYLADTMETLINEPKEKTERRVGLIKSSRHLSPFDHSFITLQIRDIPKIVAMALNNEQFYVTNEKSARYTKMVLTPEEQAYYDKWLDIFQAEMRERCQPEDPKWYNDKRILKLAQENARYLTSVFTPTTMWYTLSYRQFNILYTLIKDESVRLSGKEDAFSQRLAKGFGDFAEMLAGLKDPNGVSYLDEGLTNNAKHRRLSLLLDKPFERCFGDFYSSSYKGSFAEYAQTERHRTLSYGITMLENPEFYIPPILKAKPELVQRWQRDCFALKSNFPQGMLVMISEGGRFEKFLEKVDERNCSQAQLEIDHQTADTLRQMYVAYSAKGDDEKVELLKPHLKGSRCLAGYPCSSPCGFKKGILGVNNSGLPGKEGRII